MESYRYDANGNVTEQVLTTGYKLQHTYDCLDRLIRTEGEDGRSSTYSYDAAGNVTSVTDGEGNVTKYAYTMTGKLKRVTDALGNETEYGYDVCDRLTEIRQYGEKGKECLITRYERNLSGQVTKITDPMGGEETYTYSPRGELLSKLDREGYLTRYGYTDRGDVNHIVYTVMTEAATG